MVRVETVDYTVRGEQMVGHLAVDDSSTGPRPAVLVCHEGSGLDEHAKERAERLAGLGYAAFALDYHGGGRRLERDQMMPRIQSLRTDVDWTRELAATGLSLLLERTPADPARVAAIGYCFGGTMALELARSGADIAAVVGFHSGLATNRPAVAGDVKAAVLVCIGADDPLVPPEQRAEFEQEMRTAGVDWRMNVYGGAMHSFTNPKADMPAQGIAYHRPTDERSWRAMLDFFDERFAL